MGKILFIRGGAVGDFILTMPAIRLVRKTLPEIEIEILGYPSIAALAVATKLADRVRSIEDARLATFFAPGAKLDPDWCAYFADFDVVVSYLYDPDSYFADNLKIAGVETLIVCPFRPLESEPFIPAAIQFAKPLEQLALFLDDAELDLKYPMSPHLPAFRNDTLVALHPGSGSPKKNWSFEAWIDVLSAIRLKHQNTQFLITSGEAEESVIEQFLALLCSANIQHHHLRGCQLVELGAIYSQVDYFLGHDSGISHLAASAGTAGLLLFGPTNPKIWAPISQHMKFLKSSNESPAGISVSEVLGAIDLESCSQPRRR